MAGKNRGHHREKAEFAPPRPRPRLEPIATDCLGTAQGRPHPSHNRGRFFFCSSPPPRLHIPLASHSAIPTFPLLWLEHKTLNNSGAIACSFRSTANLMTLLVGSPPVGVKTCDAKRLQEGFELEKGLILPASKDVR